MRACFLSLFLLAAVASPLSAHAGRLWLAVGASDPTPAGIARKVKQSGGEGGLIIQTADCGDRKNLYAWAARVETTKKAAETAAKELRKTAAQDAFVKSCDVKPGTLLAHRIHAVDPSIADVPGSAVNWEDGDRVSTVIRLPDGRSVAVVRYYEAGGDDPLEGRRSRVILLDPAGTHRELVKNCFDASGFTVRKGYLAFQCATEEAGDHLMHSVLLFDWDGRRMKEFNRCRNPRFAGGNLHCKAESVKADGTLTLQSVSYRISR